MAIRRPVSRDIVFAAVLVCSYLFAGVVALLLAITWIDGRFWLGGLAVFACFAWLALVVWAIGRFGARGAWTLAGVLILNPVVIFIVGLNYTCAVNHACL